MKTLIIIIVTMTYDDLPTQVYEQPMSSMASCIVAANTIMDSERTAGSWKSVEVECREERGA